MDAITAALVALKIDTDNAQKYAQKLWEQDVTTPGLLAFVDKDVLKAAGITSPVHVNAILAGAKTVPVASATVSAVRYDAFLTHNWGGGNHEKVSEINQTLKREGLKTWFDEEKMTGPHVLKDMTNGMDKSRRMVVFVTKTYMEKVMGTDNTDNCQREFSYADSTKKGSMNMIPVVMEEEMRDQSKWKGLLGIVLGKALYYDLSPSVVGAAREKNIKGLVNAIKGKTGTDGNTGAAAQEPLGKSKRKHLLFFSYAQNDTTAETALFYTAAKSMWPEASIFRDANQVLPFDRHVEEVQDADNVVVLLSSSYAQRPYTMVELVYALRAGANVLAVRVVQQGIDTFDFKTVGDCVKNKDVTDFFDEEAWQLLASQGIGPDDVCDALAYVLNVKAPDFFSVSQAKSVQDAMIAQNFKGLRVLDTPKPNIHVVPKPYVPTYLAAITAGDATKIVRVLKVEGIKNAELAAMCCEKIGQIKREDKAGRMPFVNAGACEPVVAVLRAWTKMDALVVQWVCAAIKVLSRGNNENLLFGGLGACEAVIAALITWGKTDARVAEWGCGAVWSLSDNDANKTRLGNCGACDAVVAALSVWGKTDARVAEQGCGAVWNLSINDTNKTRLGDCGACEAVIAALSTWRKTDAQVAEQGCGAVRNLSANNDANRTRLVSSGACEAALAALIAWGKTDARVAEHGCGAVQNLSLDDASKTMLGNGGACEAVVAALSAWGKTDARVAEYGCGAAWNLSANNYANKTRLGNGGACEAVVAALSAWGKTNARVVENGCGAVRNLSANNDAIRTRLGNGGACEALIATLITWGKTDARVAEEGCGAVRNLSANNDAIRTRLGNGGACEALIAALIAWGKTDARVAECGCGAVRNLSLDDANQTRLGYGGACKAVVAALIAWGKTDARVAEKGCGAVWNLSFGNSANKQRLIKGGAVAAVQETMSNDSRNDALNELRG